MILADYAGRSYDISAFSGGSPSGDVLLIPELASEGAGGEICTGAAKLAQRFLIELLTEAGSLRYQPERGTYFLSTLQSGRARNETDVFTAFALAVGRVERMFASIERTTDPADERFERAELTLLTFRPDGLRLTIALTSRAGATRPVILPIPIVA